MEECQGGTSASERRDSVKEQKAKDVSPAASSTEEVAGGAVGGGSSEKSSTAAGKSGNGKKVRVVG